MKYVGKNIRLLRQKNGWKQSYVACRLNISIPAFSKIETNTTDINLSRLAEIAAVFNVTVIELLGASNDAIIKPYEDEIAKYRILLDAKDKEVFILQQKLIDVLDEIRLTKKTLC